MIIIIVGLSVVIIVVAITSRSELKKKRICIIIVRPLINSKITNYFGTDDYGEPGVVGCTHSTHGRSDFKHLNHGE